MIDKASPRKRIAGYQHGEASGQGQRGAAGYINTI